MTEEIRFFIREEPYGFLSNFERTGFEAKQYGKKWGQLIFYPTNEHYYQAQKANNQKLHDYIRSAPHARIAMVLGNQIEQNKHLKDKYLRYSWSYLELPVMLTGIRHKFKDEKLKQMLLKTDYATLHEDNPDDPFWGTGDGSGDSWLGKLLMVVREESRGWSCKDFGYCRCDSFGEIQKNCPVFEICSDMAVYLLHEADKYE